MRCRGLHRPANPAYLSQFLFSALRCVTPYYVRGGVNIALLSTPSKANPTFCNQDAGQMANATPVRIKAIWITGPTASRVQPFLRWQMTRSSS